MTGIYSITNIANGKIYIGQSISLESRKRDHFSKLRKHRHRNTHLQAAFDQYGPGSFRFAVLELVLNPNLLDSRERHWIATFHSSNPSFGYNYESGGRKNSNPSRSTIIKMSRSQLKAQSARREREYSTYSD